MVKTINWEEPNRVLTPHAPKMAWLTVTVEKVVTDRHTDTQTQNDSLTPLAHMHRVVITEVLLCLCSNSVTLYMTIIVMYRVTELEQNLNNIGSAQCRPLTHQLFHAFLQLFAIHLVNKTVSAHYRGYVGALEHGMEVTVSNVSLSGLYIIHILYQHSDSRQLAIMIDACVYLYIWKL